LQALENSVSRLAAMPGQRSLVLVSTGFLTETQAEKVDAIINRALQKEVVISAIHSPGLEAPAPDEEAGQTNQLPPTLEVTKNTLKNTASAYLTSVLASLSSGTGGVFFYNNNDFDEGFRRAAAVPESEWEISLPQGDPQHSRTFHHPSAPRLLCLQIGAGLDSRVPPHNFIDRRVEPHEAELRPPPRQHSQLAGPHEFTLKVGDSLMTAIDGGLAHCRFGIVVLSNNFFCRIVPVKRPSTPGSSQRQATGPLTACGSAVLMPSAGKEGRIWPVSIGFKSACQ
jgi:hypothetical protein